MNVFACDEGPVTAASYLADRHVVKMTLETAQILSTVCHHKSIGFEGQYKPTHQRHPVVLVATADPAYLNWLINHGYGLANEYSRRFGRLHKSAAIIAGANVALADYFGPAGLSAAPYCGPAEHRTDSIVESYRRYLRAKYQQWGSDARWTNSNPPTWMEG